MKLYQIIALMIFHLISLNTNLAQASTVTFGPFGAITGRLNGIPGESGPLTERKEIIEEKDIANLGPNEARVVYWIPTSCDTLAERGYTCLSCTESLHCMGGNFALKAICGGRRPFCANGVCSDLRSDKCRRGTPPDLYHDDIPEIATTSQPTTAPTVQEEVQTD